MKKAEAKIGDVTLYDDPAKLPNGCMRAHLAESNESEFCLFIKNLAEDIKPQLEKSKETEYINTTGKYAKTIKNMQEYVTHAKDNPNYSKAKNSSYALFSRIVESVQEIEKGSKIESVQEIEKGSKIDFRDRFKTSHTISFPQTSVVSTKVVEKASNSFKDKLKEFQKDKINASDIRGQASLGSSRFLYAKYSDSDLSNRENGIQMYADVAIQYYNQEIYAKIKSDKTISPDIKNQNTQFASARTNQELILEQHCFTEEGIQNIPEGKTKNEILSMMRARDGIVAGATNFIRETIRLEDEYFNRMKADLRNFVEQNNELKQKKIRAKGKEPKERISTKVATVNGVFSNGISGLKSQSFNPNESIRSIESPLSANSLNNSTTSGKLVTIKSDALGAEVNEANVMKGIIETSMPNVKVEIKDEYYILHFEGKEQKVHAYKISEFNKIFQEKEEEKDKIEDSIVSTINELDKMQSCMELKQLNESTKKQIVSKLIVIPEYAENSKPEVYIVPGSENKLIVLEHITEPTEILSVSELSERLSKNGLEINIAKQLERKLEKLMIIEEEPAMTEQTYVTSLRNHTAVLEETPIIRHDMYLHQEPEKVMLSQTENNLNQIESTEVFEKTKKARLMLNNSNNRSYKSFCQTFNGLESRNKNKEVRFNPIAQTILFDKNENEDLEFEPMSKYFSPKVVEKLREAREKDKSFKNKVKSMYDLINHKRYEVLQALLENDIIPEDLEVIEDKWFANKKKVLEENPKISKEEFEREEIDYKDQLVYNRRKEFTESVKTNRITQDPDKIKEVSYLYKRCYELSTSDREKRIRRRVELEELEESRVIWSSIMAPIYANKALLAEQRAKEEAEKGPRISTFGALLEIGSSLTAYVAHEAEKRKAAEPYYSGMPESNGSTDTHPPYQSPMFLNSNNTSSAVKSTSTTDSTCSTNIRQTTRATWGAPSTGSEYAIQTRATWGAISTGSDYAVNRWSISSNMSSLGYASQSEGSQMSLNNWASKANNNHRSSMFS